MPSSFALFTTAALAVGSVLASPTYNPKPSQPYCKATQQNANFDDLTGIPGTTLQPVQTPYKNLFFQAFALVPTVSTGGLLPGVRPQSGTNYAGAGLTSELTAGTPMLTVFYPESNTKSFTLQDFYFACTTQLANGATAVPSACNIAITGYRGSDNSVSNAKQVCSQQFQYNPSTALGLQNMAYSGKVKGCTDIQFAIVQFTPPGGAAATSPLLAFIVDDVRYTTCSK